MEAALPNYFRPRKLSDALSYLADSRVRVVGGCTDVLAATIKPALVEPLLDVTAIDGMRGIADTADFWRIGGATTWSDVIAAPLPPAFDSLKRAAREIGSVQIQNTATVAGNLCNASPAADGVPPLLVLDASVELASMTGTRTLPLGNFLQAPGTTALRDDELLSAVLVPKSAAYGNSGFVKLGTRKYLVISIVMAAVRLVESQGKVEQIAIAVGSCSPVAARLNSLESRLTGQQSGPGLVSLVTDELMARDLSPIDDVRASAEYRQQAAVEIVRRAIAQAVGEA